MTEGCLTVTLHLTEVLSAVAVIEAVPGFFARILPFSSTEAMLDLDDLKVTGCPVDADAFNFFDSPASRVILS